MMEDEKDEVLAPEASNQPEVTPTPAQETEPETTEGEEKKDDEEAAA